MKLSPHWRYRVWPALMLFSSLALLADFKATAVVLFVLAILALVFVSP